MINKEDYELDNEGNLLLKLKKVTDADLLEKLKNLYSSNQAMGITKSILHIKKNPDCYYVKTNGDWFWFCEQ